MAITKPSLFPGPSGSGDKEGGEGEVGGILEMMEWGG